MEAELKNEFWYTASTGIIRRKNQHGNYAAGTVAGCRRGAGYVVVVLNGVQMLAHRLAWFLHTGEQPPEQIDHIDRNRSNNKWSNLRAACPSTNQQNIAVHTRSKTGVKGIFPVRGGALYRAEICINGKRVQKHSTSVAVLEAWLEVNRPLLHTHLPSMNDKEKVA